MQLIDCNSLPVDITRMYGGATGSKIAVQYNGNWYMLKSQQKLKDKNLRNVDLSYANDPITEYIGSHIYGLLGIPVHETLLGMYRGKICVLCKDLAYPKSITEFRQLRNTLMDEEVIQHSSGMSTSIDDIMEVIKIYPAINKEECIKRFWIMFAVDSLLGNTDRNNGNWGFLLKGDTYQLCPVYDCGGCLNNKRSDQQLQYDMDTGKFKDLALNYTLNYKNKKGKRINSFHYMKKEMNVHLQEGVNLVSNIDILAIINLIMSLGDIISPIRRLYYTNILDLRLTEIRKYRR